MPQIPASQYPRFDTPLRITGDALIMSDLHIPYHHSEFSNHCLDLAAAWGVPNLILAGDAMDWQSVSAWGAEFRQGAKATPATGQILDMLASENIPQKHKEKFIAMLEQSGVLQPDASISGELATLREVLRILKRQFTNVYNVLGNHEDRLLRKLEGVLSSGDLMSFVLGPDHGIFTDAYYWCELYSAGQKYLIEHPRGAGAQDAIKLASKYRCSVIMGHSHAWSINRDISGAYWAIQTGCCADEQRMAYVTARHNTRPVHCLGATIVKNGYPYVLGEFSPWDDLARIF